MSFKVDFVVQDSILVVALEGKALEDTVLKQVLKDIDKQIGAVKGKLIINIEKLDYINSTGINFFIKALTKARVSKGDLILSGAQGSVLTIVTLSKMNEVFTMTENLQEALTIHKTIK